ncbi:ras-related protein rab-5c [Anaeramoeba ignava]|uniref:Ras-related protein rab-5c n=1 Tax=Anaeramoeba ignava TaxID=1746090 RepID=A0A9Q0LQU4_ANAIG|nr:ras-related protein rab-5c [Anaeramoeba ignava]
MSFRKTNQHKVVLLGESGVGKSCLALRFCKDEFTGYQEPTIGVSFLTKSMVINDTQIKLQIWDTAGQERYHSLTPMYIRNATAAVVVYDITKKETLEKAKDWIYQLLSQTSDVLIAIAGNKYDLTDVREVDKEEVKSYAEENRLIFYETSAKTGDGVVPLFSELANNLCMIHHSNIQSEKHQEKEEKIKTENNGFVDVNMAHKAKQNKGCC